MKQQAVHFQYSRPGGGDPFRSTAGTARASSSPGESAIPETSGSASVGWATRSARRYSTDDYPPRMHSSVRSQSPAGSNRGSESEGGSDPGDRDGSVGRSPGGSIPDGDITMADMLAMQREYDQQLHMPEEQYQDQEQYQEQYQEQDHQDQDQVMSEQQLGLDLWSTLDTEPI